MKLTLSLFLTLVVAASTIAATPDIRSMVIGDETIALTDTRQLTFREDGCITDAAISPDGKWLAFISEFGVDQSSQVRKLCLVKTSGGRPIVLATGVGDYWEPEAMNEDESRDIWFFDGSLDWSADSKYIGVGAQKATADMTGITPQQRYVLLYQPTSKKPIEQPLTSPADPIFKVSPTARQIAVTDLVTDAKDQESESSLKLVIYDTQTHKQKVVAADGEIARILRWDDQARSLVCETGTNGRPSVKKIWLDGTQTQLLADGYASELSPDCKFRVVFGDTFMVHNTATDKTGPIVESGGYDFLGWAPNSSFMLLAQSDLISDDTGKRSVHLTRLWLARPEKAPLNTLLVASGIEELHCMPTWSAKADRLAYVSGGQAYLASFELGVPNVDQKLAAGIELTEEEEKQMLLQNGKEIGVAMQVYSNDWDETLPGADSYEEDLKDYTRRSDLFFRPGSKMSIFKYLLASGTKLSSIENQADTPIGELDAGYSWKVVIYADCHTKVVQKQKSEAQ